MSITKFLNKTMYNLKFNKKNLFLSPKNPVFESKKPVFESKKPVFGSKSQEKVRKLFYHKLSENYEKMTLNLNFENRKKLILTQKPTQKFG